MPLIVCPACGPESLSYSGRIVMRICGACRDGVRQGVADMNEGKVTPWDEVKQGLYPTVKEKYGEKYGFSQQP